MLTEVARRLFQVEEYHKMVSAGILTENDKVELINGEIIEMSPIGSRHAACVGRLIALLVPQLLGKAIVFPQNPIVLPNFSEPEPDISVLKQTKDFYAEQLPQPQDVLLLIEIADSSLSFDREVKLPLYAKAGIPQTWLVNLLDDEVEAHSSPKDGKYTRREIFRPGDQIAFDDFEMQFEVNQILGVV